MLVRQGLPGIVLLGLLAGCGGSDGGSEREVSGVLQAGGIAGVRYTTPTRNGTTDASGTFRYLPGETVTFSLGGIRLGSVPGASIVTPFTLAGQPPPTTEPALRRELDRAQRMATPFVRAANMQRLFMALDADHDPANGYDLRNTDMRLAGATIDLELRLLEFAIRLEKLVPNLTHDIPLSRPVVQLYRELGVSVAVHGQTRSVTTLDFGLQSSDEFRTYGPDGARQSMGSDYDGDADSESLTSWLYDDMGRIDTTSSLYVPMMGLPAQVRHLNFDRDARGALTGVFEELHEDDDGLPDLRHQYAVQPDSFGYWQRQVVNIYVGADENPDRREEYRRQYDARHNVITTEYEGDDDLDGIVDWRQVEAGTLDASDRPLNRTLEFDDDADGIVDARYVSIYDYSTADTVVYDNLVDDDADGAADLRYRLVTRYDGSGNVTSVDEDYDYDNDGISEYSLRTVSTYDGERRRLTQQRMEDYDGNGVFDSRNDDTFTFDDVGNRLSLRNELDDGVDGQIEAWATETYEYGAGGELLGSRFDFHAPSNPEGGFGSTSVVTQTPFADGVLLLAQEYLDFGMAGAVP